VVSEYAVLHGLPKGTGNIAGTVTCNGTPVVPDHAHMRVWSSQPGSACGIRAYTASAQGTDASYKLVALAGGQCWAPSQPVAAFIRGNCGGRYRQVTAHVAVTTGATLPLDVELATGADLGPAH
jgi:hypothetical protein